MLSLLEKAVDNMFMGCMPTSWLEEPAMGAFGVSPTHIGPGDVEINGIALPRHVAEQIARLGMHLGSYSPKQIEAAKLGCLIDCTLVDDHEGHDFEDMLEQTDDERECNHDTASQYNALVIRPPKGIPGGNDFASIMQHAREQGLSVQGQDICYSPPYA